MPVFLILSILLATSVLIVCRMTIRIVRLKSRPCNEVLYGMRHVNLREIAAIAGGSSVKYTRHISSSDLIDRLGGIEGLQRMRHNAGAMIDVARYLTLMRPHDDIVARTIREDALTVRRLVLLLYWRYRCRLSLPDPGVVQQLAKSYDALSDNMVFLCNALLLEVVPILDEAIQVHARMLRTEQAPVQCYTEPGSVGT